MVKKCFRELGLSKDLHLHSLRHTAITRMIEAGTPIRTVQRYVDHSSIRTTEVYAHDKILNDCINICIRVTDKIYSHFKPVIGGEELFRLFKR